MTRKITHLTHKTITEYLLLLLLLLRILYYYECYTKKFSTKLL